MSLTPGSAEIDHAASLLRAGRVVALPTETVYGLGANALDAEAVARIYAVKRRPPTSPMIVHVSSVEMAKSLVAFWPVKADLLAGKFWPGPLTMVLTKIVLNKMVLNKDGATPPVPADPASTFAASPRIPDIVTAGLATVGLRMPAHPVALALIRAAGVPLAAPSANRFTELSPTTAEHVRQSLGADVDYVLDGGPCEVGIESTVVSLAADPPVLLRPGGVSRAELEALLGPIASAGAPSAGAHPSPGMHPRHYSPRTPVRLVRDGKLPETGRGIYLQRTAPARRAGVMTVQMPLLAPDYAAALYRQLHQADDLGCDWIAVELPPAGPEWEAVHDRLSRAASSEKTS